MKASHLKTPKWTQVAAITAALFTSGLACTQGKPTANSTTPAGASISSTTTVGLPTSDVNVFVNLAKKVVPSVVNISTSSAVKSPLTRGAPDDPFRKFFEDFFGGKLPGDPWGGGMPDRGERDAPRAVALGTGFVIEANGNSEGLILTNNHVVENADEIKITFTEDPTEKPTDGEVVGRDSELDVALIKVKSKREMIPLPLGDSDGLQVGEYVVAVGNPFGQGHSVTHGIISAKGRPLRDFPLSTYLQTDTPINPGNSGGPLVNLQGEVIGINNAIDARAQGIGFAIPINSVKQILTQLKEKGSVTRGYIGALIGELTPDIALQMGAPGDLRAPFVTHIYPGAPAEKAGIKPYDVILEFNGRKVGSASELIGAVTAVPVGEAAPVKISRNGKEMKLTLKVAKRPTSGDVATTQPMGRGSRHKPSVNTGMELETLNADLARRLGLSPGAKGAVVASISYGGPADKAGLARGDVIVEVDRKPIESADDFYEKAGSRKSYLLRVMRMGPENQESFAVLVLDLKK